MKTCQIINEMSTELTDRLGNKSQKKSNFRFIGGYTILYLAYLGNLVWDYVSDKIMPNTKLHN